jgi:hypothetical protein
MRTGSCMIEGEDDHLPTLKWERQPNSHWRHERTLQLGDPGSYRNRAARDGQSLRALGRGCQARGVFVWDRQTVLGDE